MLSGIFRMGRSSYDYIRKVDRAIITNPSTSILFRVVISRATTRLLTASEFRTVAYSLVTQHESGLFKVIPMKGQLALDAAQSAVVVSSPALFAKTGQKSVIARIVWDQCGRSI